METVVEESKETKKYAIIASTIACIVCTASLAYIVYKRGPSWLLGKETDSYKACYILNNLLVLVLVIPSCVYRRPIPQMILTVLNLICVSIACYLTYRFSPGGSKIKGVCETNNKTAGNNSTYEGGYNNYSANYKYNAPKSQYLQAIRKAQEESQWMLYATHGYPADYDQKADPEKGGFDRYAYSHKNRDPSAGAAGHFFKSWESSPVYYVLATRKNGKLTRKANISRKDIEELRARAKAETVGLHVLLLTSDDFSDLLKGVNCQPEGDLIFRNLSVADIDKHSEEENVFRQTYGDLFEVLDTRQNEVYLTRLDVARYYNNDRVVMSFGQNTVAKIEATLEERLVALRKLRVPDLYNYRSTNKDPNQRVVVIKKEPIFIYEDLADVTFEELAKGIEENEYFRLQTLDS